MNSKIENIALEQIKSANMDQIFNQRTFFKEFFNVFYDNKPFSEDVVKSIKRDFDINKVTDLSDKLINIFEKRLEDLSEVGIENEIGLIIFIGDGNIDGHSIVIDDSTYVFVDLEAIISRYGSNLEAFLSHEIIHAVHYNLNKEFYPENYKSVEDKYLKTLIEEGLATYMNMLIFGFSRNSSYWLDILKSDEVMEWVSSCEKEKISIGKKLNELIENKQYDNSLYLKLFCIKKSEKLTEYRMGYYYGSEIIRKICSENSVNQVFNLKFSDVKNYINEYFETYIAK